MTRYTRKHVVRRSTLAAVVVAIAAMLAACGGEESAQAVAFPDSLIDDEVVAAVNSQPIIGRDLKVFTMVYQPATLDSLRSRMFNVILLNGYIDRVLLYQEAVAVGVVVNDSTTAWFVENFINALGGPERVRGFLATVGVTADDLRTTIHRDLVVRSFIEGSLTGGIEVAETDARMYYDTNLDRFAVPDSAHARHIILASGPGETEESAQQKRNILRELRSRAQAGESFAELAKEFSEGPSAPNGGDLGYFARPDMVREFSEVAFSMKPGEVSDVVRTSFGFHIIYLEDLVPARTLPYDEVADALKNQMRQRDVNVVIENHLNRSRAVAIIEPNFDFGGLTQRESATFTR